MTTPQQQQLGRPTAAFIGASWLALAIGAGLFFIGLWNAQIELNSKGFYLVVFLLGLFSAISVQKAVRDRAEDIPVTGVYLGVAWGMLLASLVLVSVGLWNADMSLSEKGFYAIGFTMSLFAVVAVQKNVRDLAAFREAYPERPRPVQPVDGRPPFAGGLDKRDNGGTPPPPRPGQQG